MNASKRENVATRIWIHILACILSLRLHRDTWTQTEPSKLRHILYQHLNLYLSAVILKEIRLVSGQYTHTITTPLSHTHTHRVHNDFHWVCVCLFLQCYTHKQTHKCSSGPLEDEKERGSGTHWHLALQMTDAKARWTIWVCHTHTETHTCVYANIHENKLKCCKKQTVTQHVWKAPCAHSQIIFITCPRVRHLEQVCSIK